MTTVKDDLEVINDERADARRRVECLNDLADISKQLEDISKVIQVADCVTTCVCTT